MRCLIIALALTLAHGLAWGLEPDEILDDPVLEERARELSGQLRCVVCLNQDIDSSNAGVARTMRVLLRERLVAGDSDREVLAFFVERYGDFVLFRPPLKGSTYILWLAPAAIFGIGVVVVTVTLRRRRPLDRSGPLPVLSMADEQEIARIVRCRDSDLS